MLFVLYFLVVYACVYTSLGLYNFYQVCVTISTLEVNVFVFVNALVFVTRMKSNQVFTLITGGFVVYSPQGCRLE